MKYILILLLLTFSFNATADKYVNGYTRKDGTYVEGHFKSESNGSKLDNYSSKGNSNPYTGERGYNDPYKVDNNYGYDQSRQFKGSFGK